MAAPGSGPIPAEPLETQSPGMTAEASEISPASAHSTMSVPTDGERPCPGV
jgi:hypothetical protein